MPKRNPWALERHGQSPVKLQNVVKGNGSWILDVYCKSFLSRYTPQGQVHPTSIFRARILCAFAQCPRMNRRKVVPKAMTGSWPSMTDVSLPKIGLLQGAIMIHMGFRGCLVVVRVRSHTHFGRWRLEAGNMCSARRALELGRFRWFQVLWKLGNLSCWIHPCSISYQRKLGSNTSELRTNRILRLEMMKGGII